MTREQLTIELLTLRKRNAELETSKISQERMEEALHEIEERFRSLIETASDWIWEVDNDGVYTYASPKVKDLLGYEPDEVIGKTAFDMKPLDEAKRVRNIFREVVASKQPIERLENVNLHKDGHSVVLETSGVPILGPDSNLLGYRGIDRDISERKQAEIILQIQFELGVALSGTRELGEALSLILDAAIKVAGMDAGGIYLVDWDTKAIKLTHSKGLSPEFVEHISHYEANSDRARLVMRGTPIYVDYEDLQVLKSEIDRREDLHASAIIPVLHRGKVIACLNLATHTVDTVTLTSRQAVQIVASHIGAVIARLQVEGKLAESRRNLEILFNTLDDFLFILDADGCILHVNRAVERRLGYSAKKLTGLSVLRVHSAERREEAATIVSDMLAGKRETCPIPLITKDGMLIPVETKISWGQWSGKKALFGLSRDITERKRAEVLARIQRALALSISAATRLDEVLDICFKAAIQASGMDCGGIYLVDDTSGALDFVFYKGLPPAFVQAALHYDADTANARLVMEGKPVYTCHRQLGVPLEDMELDEELRAIAVVPVRHEDRVIGCLNIASHTLFEVPSIARNALETIASQIGSAIANKLAEEELKRYHEHLEELVKERTRKLEEAQAELIRQERLSALGQLTATVAHEIRNPLGTVRTCIFGIGDAIERDEMERIERALQMAERNIVRCDAIINELLDYTRDRVLQPKPTQIDIWLKTVLDELFIPEGIISSRELCAGIEIQIDRDYLRRAVINIVNNAVRALQDEESTGNQFSVGSRVVDDRLEIWVNDTGPGIPDDILDKIFEPLFSTRTFGVGLGLPIVKNIMEHYGGGIEIRSKEGQGTTVILFIGVEASQVTPQ